ncbi:type III secretion system export apparatus subunit SctU [Paraburkholderia phosphatilytica]|uniref:type III secretion system export apparatus subunit SctU n=1 Tax=Paraburkholderia phosphatilytica TaxID=2282883 RepID=UPI000E4DCEF6|nr:type III secretion system export apparatus subunit SctU [Paraburkholderia phosphatilytica]
MSQSDDKTEKPTPKKLKDARKDGQVAHSTDLTSAISMAAVVLLLAAGASHLEGVLKAVVTIAMQFVNGDHSDTNIHAQLMKLGGTALTAVIPCVCAAALAALFTQAAQVGVKIATKPVTPNMMAVHPMTGLKRIFSMRTAVEIAKMVVKLILVAAVMYVTVKELFPLIVASLYQPLGGLAQMIWDVMLRLVAVATAIFVLMGAADVKLQSAMFIKKLMMTKDEVKRENKQREGDPRIKRERRRLAREYVNGPAPSRVGHANVMLVNPTHYAVAIRYAPDEHPLPRVIAKGMDEQAAALRGEARDAGVPIIGNPPVARALYRVGLEQPIPEELFETVAAILRWVNAIGAKRDEPGDYRASSSSPSNTTDMPC